MRVARAAVVAALAAILAGWSATASAADGVRASANPARYPQRSFIVTLPRDVAFRAGLIRVFENGERVPTVAVTPTSDLRGNAVGMVLVIDASNSMRTSIDSAIAAAKTFAGQRYANQALAVITFNKQPYVRLPFTADSRKIQRALTRRPTLASETNLYDAVDRALRLIQGAHKTSASIVVLSDGADTGSLTDEDALLARATAMKVRVFTVGLTSRQFDPVSLQRLATRTGASYSEATSAADLAQIYRALGYQLANEYLVQYQSIAARGQKVRVRIAVTGVTGAGIATYTSPKLPTGPPPAFGRSFLDKVIQSWLTMVLVVLIMASLFALVASLVIRPRSTGLRKRLGAFVAVAVTKDGKRQTAQLSEKLLEGTERSLRRTQWWGRFKEELEIGQISLPAEQVIVLTAMGTLLLAWILSLLFSGAVALTAFALPLLVRTLIKRRVERQRRAFADQLPDNLQVLASALRAGHSLIGALSVVLDDAPEPSRREFRRVIADEQLGVPLEDALTNVAERMKNKDLDQVALVAALQREAGGNSAEVLDRVAETVRERAALRRLVRTLTAQGRMARWIVSSLPVALVLIISLLNPAYMSPLWHKTAGQILIVFAGIMVVSGSLVIRRIVNIRI